jgi:hypothetical protein
MDGERVAGPVENQDNLETWTSSFADVGWVEREPYSRDTDRIREARAGYRESHVLGRHDHRSAFLAIELDVVDTSELSDGRPDADALRSPETGVANNDSIDRELTAG